MILTYKLLSLHNVCITSLTQSHYLLILGLFIHPDKSILYPTQRLVFLGFVLDSIVMRLCLTPEKASNVKDAYQRVLLSPCPLICKVAQVLGLLTYSFPGIMHGPLHYIWTKMHKTRALQENKGFFEKPMRLST